MAEKPDKTVVRTATALVVGALAVVFDTTILSVALHTLAVDLHTTVAQIQWVTTGYLLALAATVPLSAWLLARFGGKRVWMVALAIFMAGSILSGLAWNAEALIAFRILQGVGGGLMLPVMTTLVIEVAGGKQLGRVSAVIGLPTMAGPVLGPVLGGLILTLGDWRWIFWVNIPFTVAGLLLAWRMLPSDRGRHPKRRLDVVGVVLLVPGLAGLLLGLSNSVQTGGFGRLDAWLPLVAGSRSSPRSRFGRCVGAGTRSSTCGCCACARSGRRRPCCSCRASRSTGRCCSSRCSGSRCVAPTRSAPASCWCRRVWGRWPAVRSPAGSSIASARAGSPSSASRSSPSRPCRSR